LERIIEATEPDLIVPGTDVELLIFAENRQRLEQQYGTKVLVSSSEVVGIADDKYLTYEFFRDAGFLPPESCLSGGEDQLIERVGFPLVVKPRVGARSIGVYKVDNRQELNRALECSDNPVIQECVGTDATEYTAGAVSFEGVCTATIVMRRDLRDGNTYRAFISEDSALHQEVRNYANALKPHGPVNFQFRLYDSGRPRVFEINGRFSGTTPLRACAGFNEVEMCIRYLLKSEPVVQPLIRNVVILRHWEETVVDMIDIATTAGP